MTEISFDVPSNDATYCLLNFTIALGNPGGPWTLSGNSSDRTYELAIYTLDGPVDNAADTWNSRTQPGSIVAAVAINNSGATSIAHVGSGTCAKGQVANFLLAPFDSDDQEESYDDIFFNWFGES